MKIYDISRTLHEGLPVWPGDWKFSREISSRIENGEGSNSSNIRTALHCGTHMDAPRHTIEDGPAIDEIDLSVLIGPALVVTVEGPVISPEELEVVRAKNAIRVILRCPGLEALESFEDSFAVPGAEASRFLVESGVRLLGTNAPSVDPANSKSLGSHRILMRAGIPIIENLYLKNVPDGEYELIALPLKISGADGSPVRAVLVER